MSGRGPNFLNNRLAPLAVVFLLITLFALLFSIQIQSSSTVDVINERIEAIKTDLLYSYEKAPPGGEDRRRAVVELEKLTRADAVGRMIGTYSAAPMAGMASVDFQSGSVSGRIRNLEAFLEYLEKSQRKSMELLLSMFFVLVFLIICLIAISEIQNQRKLTTERYQRDLKEHLLESLEKERQIIAFELHDSVSQKLGFIKQQMEDTHADCPKSRLLHHLVAESVRELRGIYQDLQQTNECVAPVDQQLKALFDEFRFLSKINLETSVFGLESLRLGESVSHHLYRIVQELLANAHKHSHANTVKLSVYYVPTQLRIVYSDDGAGLNGDKQKRELRLKSIDFRTKILGARMRMNEPNADQGLRLQIEVPIHEEDIAG